MPSCGHARLREGSPQWHGGTSPSLAPHEHESAAGSGKCRRSTHESEDEAQDQGELGYTRRCTEKISNSGRGQGVKYEEDEGVR